MFDIKLEDRYGLLLSIATKESINISLASQWRFINVGVLKNKTKKTNKQTILHIFAENLPIFKFPTKIRKNNYAFSCFFSLE